MSDEYDKLIVVTKTREEQLHDEMWSHSKADETFLISCSYLLELLQRASDLFERSQPEQKNRLLRFVFANASVEGEKLNYKLKSVFEGIAQCVKTKEWIPRQLAARTIVDACISVEYQIIYVGNFQPWKEELAAISEQERNSIISTKVKQ